MSASSRRAAISAAPGTGTAIPARNAIRRRWSTCRCSRKPGTCRRRNTRMRRKSSRIAAASASNSASTTTRCFTPRSTDLKWDEANSRWVIHTNRGDAFTAQFIGMGTGPLHVPKLPGISGIESFKGHSFHTSRWDYDYTGGDPSGAPMDEAGRQARRHHRHRRHLRAVRAVSGARLQGALRFPAHAVFGRRPRQRADRSGLVFGHRHARLAAALAGEFYREPGRRHRGGGSGPGRLDRSVAAHPRQDPAIAARRAHPAKHAGGL